MKKGERPRKGSKKSGRGVTFPKKGGRFDVRKKTSWDLVKKKKSRKARRRGTRHHGEERKKTSAVKRIERGRLEKVFMGGSLENGNYS